MATDSIPAYVSHSYKATNGFKLGDNEDYTLQITITIGNEKQTIELTGTVQRYG